MIGFQNEEIPHEGELLSAAIIIKDILLRLQNQKFAKVLTDFEISKSSGPVEQPADSPFQFDLWREACG